MDDQLEDFGHVVRTGASGLVAIGLRPSRLARVQRAVRLVLKNGWTWTAVAYEAGFSDQAHLAREVRALTGYRPSRLIGAPDG
jgi:methylphosphotriester-DNA--protein-cysteine methyltransferase